MATELHHCLITTSTRCPMQATCVSVSWWPNGIRRLLMPCLTVQWQHWRSTGHFRRTSMWRQFREGFELIYGAHQMVLHGGYDAVIILGSVIRWWNSTFRLYLSRRNRRHCTPECHAGNPCYLWSSDHQRPATSTGSQRRTTGEQGWWVCCCRNKKWLSSKQ